LTTSRYPRKLVIRVIFLFKRQTPLWPFKQQRKD
jgi:hypothetical protein